MNICWGDVSVSETYPLGVYLLEGCRDVALSSHFSVMLAKLLIIQGDNFNFKSMLILPHVRH